ncbi:glycoside hydrolase family 3 protein [Suhomyces tanzawaensis NRRL Y-17324]|uniref:beta-glucosidase n=1 Tax=Suhomyces tanzawaensis NRRL Y-17324 TaxID=984487 RepID=A0A1E4SBT1_9ASCO|nr:glycoside hydrolase family 3 protein [Suhomyces tanzawaensis NRRL Y-17324]ODV76852.1 glycoside hydrolase family 3 protein [Suhomyces tanzawaensis NRRL Y-17324]
MSSLMNSLDIDSLLEELTLEEKISLLAGSDFWHTVPIERLGIPSVRTSDGPNGIRGTKFFNGIPANCFPCGTALASSFNRELWREAGKLMAEEAKAKAAHCILGPTCNIVRSPVGGRCFESFSEDPFLSGFAASNIISGIQKEKVLACIKHFVCNDQEDERKAVNTVVSERAMREIYLKPFQIALREAQPKALMTAYNKVNGTHCSESQYLLQDILRDEWKWNGLVMSDWTGTYSIKDALDAGLNLEMPGPTRFREVIPVRHEVYTNKIHRKVIDSNVRQVLQFVNDCMDAGIPKDAVESPHNTPEASATLRKIGGETIVLLKNENDVLPLHNKTEKPQKIAIIGPNAKVAQDSGGGSAAMNASYKVTPFEGFRSKIEEGDGSVSLDYSLGCYLDRNLPDIGHLLRDDEGNPGVTAKFYKKPRTGTSDDNRELFETFHFKSTRFYLSDFKSKHLKPGELLFYTDFTGTFVPEETATYEFGCSVLGTAQIFVDDKLVVDNKTHQVAGEDFFLGIGTRQELGSVDLEKGREYKIRVEFGSGATYTLSSQYSERGGIYFGARIKTTAEEDLMSAVEVAKSADKVVIFVGLSKEWESEGFDRPNMEIPGYTNQLISEIAKVNRNVIVVNQSGSPVSMPWIDNVAGLVQAWYGGNELGNAIADVLFGDVNPSGKLSMTFPKRLEDNPSFLNYGSTNGRVIYGEDIFVGYRYYEKVGREVLFPFGYGLSYTTFSLFNLRVKVEERDLKVSVSLKNTGSRKGAEVVQVYVAQDKPNIIKPVKELRDFTKVTLDPGQEREVYFTIPLNDATGYWNTYSESWESDAGAYKVLVGSSSRDADLLQGFSIEKSSSWLGL